MAVATIPINPKLPPNFDHTPNDRRPASHRRWWHRPYIVSESVEDRDREFAERNDEYAEAGRKYWQEEGRAKWMAAWKSGTRYDVRCLDGGAWDRSTWWGSFDTLEAAIACAQSQTNPKATA
jgi:hypothetical protein